MPRGDSTLLRSSHKRLGRLLDRNNLVVVGTINVSSSTSDR